MFWLEIFDFRGFEVDRFSLRIANVVPEVSYVAPFVVVEVVEKSPSK
ncbi:hypothetical protein HY624_02850 [Candidatus Uhrbacteria bacterium]|nr:hypothetical protein [Candidatus Uhrbacteria bacterium]